MRRSSALRASSLRRRRRPARRSPIPARRRPPSPSPTWPCWAASQLRHIGGGEVDRVEQQRREAGVLRRIGDDLAGEREQQARRFDQQERRQRFVGEIAQPVEAGVAEVDQEVDALVGAGRDLDLEHDLVDVVGDRLSTLMLNWTSSWGWTCHWKACGELGLSTDKSLIYCAIVATCGSLSGSAGAISAGDRVLVGHAACSSLGVFEDCSRTRKRGCALPGRLAVAEMGRNGDWRRCATLVDTGTV